MHIIIVIVVSIASVVRGVGSSATGHIYIGIRTTCGIIGGTIGRMITTLVVIIITVAVILLLQESRLLSSQCRFHC